MGTYVVHRVLSGLIVLFIISVVTFVGLSIAPGDPLTSRMSPAALAQLSPSELAAKRHALGLDQPIPIRYAKWLSGVLHGDLGYSTSDSMPVAQAVRMHIGPTLLLMAGALLLGVVLAIPLGIIAAVRERTWVDYILGTLPLILIGVPSFVLGLLAIYGLSVKLSLLPAGGMHTLGDESLSDLMTHLLLPACVLSVVVVAPLIRYTRSGMLDALRSEYIITARSKGLAGRIVTVRHAFRNALVPIITVVGLLVAQLTAGTVVIEQIFDWPGLGQLAVRAAGNRDVSLMLSIILFVGGAVVLINVVTDILSAWVDPRIRLD